MGWGKKSARGDELDLLALKVFENVALEESWAAEECMLGFRHALAVQKPAFNERGRTHKVGDLKQLIVLRSDVLRELNALSERCRKSRVQQICHG